LKFNLKEILELNLTNDNNLTNVKNQFDNIHTQGITPDALEDEITRLEEEMANIKKSIEENEAEKEKISNGLEKNIKVKKMLKKLLFKFISNTQMKEIKDLQEGYTGLVNEKKRIRS